MATTTSSRQARQPKTKRIAVRLTAELDERINRAVALSGRTQTEFISEALAEKADEIIRAQYHMELSERDMEALLDAIENPPEPNEAMLRAISSWRERFQPAT